MTTYLRSAALMTASHQPSRSRRVLRTADKGHEERFPSTRLNAGFGFRKETIAGMRGNGRDAPFPDPPSLATERGGSTLSGRSVPAAEIETPRTRDFP